MNSHPEDLVGSSDVDLAQLIEAILVTLNIKKPRVHEPAALVLLQTIEQLAQSGAEIDLNRALARLESTLEALLHRQLDEILHAPQFQAYESRWRGLVMVADALSPAASVVLLSARLDEIRADLAAGIAFKQSVLYRRLFQQSFGTAGETMISAIIAGYAFNTTEPDVSLLKRLSDLAAEIFAPFIANLDPQGIKADWHCFKSLPTMDQRELAELFSAPEKAAWE